MSKVIRKNISGNLEKGPSHSPHRVILSDPTFQVNHIHLEQIELWTKSP